MRFQVLQGVNLKNDRTTVTGYFDAKPTKEFFEMVNNLHEVFMYSYDLDEQANTVEVQTKLPHFWREAMKGINLYITEAQDKEATKNYILQLIKMTIGNMSAIPTVAATIKKNLELTQYYYKDGLHTDYDESTWNKYHVIGCGTESEIFKLSASSQDSKDGLMIQRDKTRTNQLINRLQLPIAKWDIIDSEEDLIKLLDDYTYPVVIKPGGLTRGNGVVTNIFDEKQALDAYKYAYDIVNSKARSKYARKIIIQEQVIGNDYRLMVFDGKMQIATLRTPANVTGNGKSTLKELIEETNKDPRRDTMSPLHTLKPIKFDEMLDQYLNEQGLTLDYVPKQDEVVYVRKIASMSMGGMTEDVTDKVHPQIRNYVESLPASAHAYLLGIDILCEDISKPLTEQKGSFIEMNSMPELYLNAFPTTGKQYPEIGEKFIEGLLKGKEMTRKYVVIGGSTQSVLDDFNNHKDNKIGVYSNNTIYINGEKMNDNLVNWEAIEALKINASLNTIILHYETLNEATQIGLGFDVIDELYINDKLSKDVKARIKELKKKGLIKKVK